MPANEFTKLAMRYPVGYSASSGAFFAVFLAVFGRNVVAVLVVGVLLAIVNWVLWRPNGLLSRKESPSSEPVDLGVVLQSVAVGLTIFGLTFLVFWLTRR